MVFDPFEMKIDSRQAVIPETQITPSIELIDDFKIYYMNIDALVVTSNCYAWLEKRAPCFSNVIDDDYKDQMLKVIRLPEGLVVDMTDCIEQFKRLDKDEIIFAALDYSDEEIEKDFLPVMDVIKDEFTLKRFKNTYKDYYDMDYPEVEVAEPSEE